MFSEDQPAAVGDGLDPWDRDLVKVPQHRGQDDISEVLHQIRAHQRKEQATGGRVLLPGGPQDILLDQALHDGADLRGESVVLPPGEKAGDRLVQLVELLPVLVPPKGPGPTQQEFQPVAKLLALQVRLILEASPQEG